MHAAKLGIVMSWRAGFFRIWVIVTVVYLLIVAAFAYNSIANPSFREYGFVLSKSLSELRKEMLPKYEGLNDDQFVDAIHRDFYADLSRDEFKARMEQAERDGPSPVEQYSSEYADLEAASAKGEMAKIETGIPGIFMFYRSEHPMEARNRRLKEVYPLAVDLRRKLVREKRVEAIWGALGAAVFPPVILLLLGLAVAWVIAGFRRPRVTP